MQENSFYGACFQCLDSRFRLLQGRKLLARAAQLWQGPEPVAASGEAKQPQTGAGGACFIGISMRFPCIYDGLLMVFRSNSICFHHVLHLFPKLEGVGAVASALEELRSEPPGLGSESSADADDDEQQGSPKRRAKRPKGRPQRLWSLLQANRRA